jgi:hypothetical protein
MGRRKKQIEVTIMAAERNSVFKKTVGFIWIYNMQKIRNEMVCLLYFTVLKTIAFKLLEAYVYLLHFIILCQISFKNNSF